MFSSDSAKSEAVTSLDFLDRFSIGYVTVPLLIFLAGWFEWWVAVPLAGCVIYGSRGLISPSQKGKSRLPISGLQLAIALIVGCGWTLCSGADHVVFANADWHIRDAVLHDLVASPWPVGYGFLDGRESMLRAPVAFYLPAAVIGKGLGLPAAHVAMGLWTEIGATLFLMQVLSLTPSRVGVAIVVAAVVVLFSGLDIVGSLLNDGPRFRSDWNITTHLEWWAGKYQYSSMTTQLFWVPNHALGGWLTIGILCRNNRVVALDALLPIMLVALALWSPLTAIGVVPFVLWRVVANSIAEKSLRLLHPTVWFPGVMVGVVVAGYLTLDPGRIAKGMAVGGEHGSAMMDLLQQAQFFLMEAGFIGFAIFALRRSSQVALALVVLALLPLVYLGPGNDLVMRASIPSLAMLTIGACVAIVGSDAGRNALRNRLLLGALLAVGAVTPLEEFARAAVLPSWPINLQATLVAADCGRFAAHYVARLGDEAIVHLLRRPHPLALGTIGPRECDNPAFDLMWGDRDTLHRVNLSTHRQFVKKPPAESALERGLSTSTR